MAAAFALIVNFGCNGFFTTATFAINYNAVICWSNQFNLPQYLLENDAVSKNVFTALKRILFRRIFFRGFIFCTSRGNNMLTNGCRLAKRLFYCYKYFIRKKGLCNIIISTK